MTNERIALLGFGDIAQRLSTRLAGYDIVGVRRSPGLLESGDVAIESVPADCRDVAQMQKLFADPVDVVVMSFVPTSMSDEGYRQGYVDTVKAVLEGLKASSSQPRLIIFVSSTSVYGQCDSSWVDEESPTEATSFSGKRLLEAEQLLDDSPYTTCNVRFSGIYGPGRRRLIDQVIAGKGPAVEPVLYSNRIHADDCAGVLAHLIELQKHSEIAPCYLASDCEPVSLYEVKQWMAEQMSLPQGHLQPATEARSRLNSKRCLNQRLVDSGYEFLYPTFRDGYLPLIKEVVEQEA